MTQGKAYGDYSFDMSTTACYHQRMKTRIKLLKLQVFTTTCTTVLLLLSPFTASVSAASGYSCSPNHCYGELYAVDTTQYPITGVQTSLSVTPITGTSGYLTNEIWLLNKTNGSWIEAGLIKGAGTQDWFWASWDPSGWHIYYSNSLGPNDFNHNATITIANVSGTTTWNVSIIGNQTSFSGQAVNSLDSAASIQVGAELYGTGGLSEHTAHFTRNQWITGGTAYQYLPNQGPPYDIVTSGNPPYAWMAKSLSDGQGGDVAVCVEASKKQC